MIKELKNGIKINYIEAGSGKGYPLLFFHGNGESLEIFKDYINDFNDYRMILVDSRSHGLSSSGPLDYDLMAQDMLELVEEIGLDRYSIIGFSDGAIISILMSKLTDRIDKMFLIGLNLNPIGLTDEAVEMLRSMDNEYSRLCLEQPDIDPYSLKEVSSRAIVIGGQFDMIRREHLELVKKSFNNSTLYIIPNADHMIPMNSHKELVDIINCEMMVDVYYEDNHVICVNKESGILSQEDETKDPDLLNITKKYLKYKYHKDGNVYLGLVQRLDRNVSGLMVFAKTSKAAARLNEYRPKKHYLAVVHGILDKKEGKLVNYLSKDEKKKESYEDLEKGKLSILNYKVISEKDDLSLVEVLLETGRFHQIRCQFSLIGHPLYNDAKYGEKDFDSYRIGLDAYKVEFVQTVSKLRMEMERKPKGMPFDFFEF